MCSVCNASRIIHEMDNFSIRTKPCPVCPSEAEKERDNRLAAIEEKLDGLDNGQD